MIKILISLLISVISASSLAETAEIPTEKIVGAITRYANKVGCFIYMDEENIVRYEIQGSPYFIAMYSIDTGCTTGNNMHRPAFAALSTDKRGKVFVVEKYSTPKQTPDNFPQNIVRIYIKDNKLWYTAKDYNWGVENDPKKTDGICCPSLSFDAEFYFDKGGWVDTRSEP
ncbi:hypothetical protein [Sideroxydans lithotrophicus]|uniref:Uncharacterized protein n=1 Tax=Sideroxydans lithotrophicus (strain ES-1) TaxID=580332 RepID=D5CM06_SIDLE|nr:hypothetical protein [Sideroxydans lithotrophicus]ADE10620.1 hypothetical protein Slit_0378 [Sideroxydans lithotrophicus ES-1]